MTIISYTIQSIVGFGSALFAIPVISLFINKSFVLPAFYTMSLFQCFVIVCKDKKYIMAREFLLMLFISVLAIPVGMLTGKFVDENIIRILIGIFIILTSFMGLYKILNVEKQLELNNNKFKIFLPFLSGFLQTIYGIGGPLIALYMESITEDKNKFRVMLSLYWLCLNPLIIIGLYIEDKIKIIHVKYFLVLIPAMIIGVFLGIKIANSFSKKRFQIFVNILLLFVGLSMIVSII